MIRFQYFIVARLRYFARQLVDAKSSALSFIHLFFVLRCHFIFFFFEKLILETIYIFKLLLYIVAYIYDIHFVN